MTYTLVDDMTNTSAVIKVIGVGGGGCNTVKHMHASDVCGVELICANTDVQCLEMMPVDMQIQLGGQTTRGLGAGSKPETGKQAALEDKERILDVLEGCDMVFIAAGMGGGTGTGAAPVIAQAAQEKDILTVAVVTRPFCFEGDRRASNAEQGLRELSQYVDSLVVISNEKLVGVLGDEYTVKDAFVEVDNVLVDSVRGITELITRPGRINVDFADVRTVMSSMGMAMMGSGEASGEDRAKMAVEQAIKCPLLENINLTGARGILVNIHAGDDITMRELHEIGDAVSEIASDEASIVIGDVTDPSMSGMVRVTLVATGLSNGLAIGLEQGPVGDAQISAVESGGASGQEETASSSGGAVPDGNATDYSQYEQPTVGRAKSQARTAGRVAGSEDPNFLDIPAFLRRQAD